MGVVYRAWQPALQRSVALKLLLAGPFASPDFARRFRREAQAAARLRHHGIVTVFDLGDCDGQPYYTMELIEGSTLADSLRSGLPSPATAARAAEKQATAAAKRLVPYAASALPPIPGGLPPGAAVASIVVTTSPK
jgi:serine/threonine protein kinase